tara:strand:+ start:26021 stop:26593 length:573 start_codon:yes stop_codon:yes gene_type:complete
MSDKQTEIAIKNMVCDRCISVVKSLLEENNFDFSDVRLGNISFKKQLSENEVNHLSLKLKNEGFEIIHSIDDQLVSQIKTLVIQNIFHEKEILDGQKFSDYLSSNIGVNYSRLSKLFSMHENSTIEHYIIFQKIERAKELLSYNELTLSQISYELNYSSPQHLSRQFKQITGSTPSIFKKNGARAKLDTI